MPEDMPDRMPDRMPEDMSEYMPEDMPDRMPDRMPEDMSDRMPEDMPDRMPEDLPDRMPEDMPEDMPEHMPDRMPEDMSDRMPQDLPVRKCTNVMVGITRSKVIQGFFSNYKGIQPKYPKVARKHSLIWSMSCGPHWGKQNGAVANPMVVPLATSLITAVSATATGHNSAHVSCNRNRNWQAIISLVAQFKCCFF